MAMLSGLAGEESVQECMLTCQDGAVVQNLTLRVWSAPLNYGDENFTVLAGMDISQERRRLALEKTFFQRDFSTKGPDRGLGTYSMKLLSHFLSGNVHFVSSSESGTRFTLSLSAAPP
jgi:hypothetical protein